VIFRVLARRLFDHLAHDRQPVMAAPGTIRPGGRTGRTGRTAESVFAAATAERAERGYADISIESIAARAGVHKTTLYRRWGSKEGLIGQLLIGAAAARIQLIYTVFAVRHGGDERIAVPARPTGCRSSTGSQQI
jgi:AcrR family transcriptional regulator